MHADHDGVLRSASYLARVRDRRGAVRVPPVVRWLPLVVCRNHDCPSTLQNRRWATSPIEGGATWLTRFMTQTRLFKSNGDIWVGVLGFQVTSEKRSKEVMKSDWMTFSIEGISYLPEQRSPSHVPLSKTATSWMKTCWQDLSPLSPLYWYSCAVTSHGGAHTRGRGETVTHAHLHAYIVTVTLGHSIERFGGLFAIHLVIWESINNSQTSPL